MNNGVCIKCKSHNIKKIGGLPVRINLRILLCPDYYVCLDCGYMEKWLDEKEKKKINVFE